MTRVPMIPLDDLDAAQRAIYDIIPRSADRKIVHGPVTALFHSPELARRLQGLGAFIHNHTVFETRLKELAILATVRPWSALYPWNSHAAAAEKRGVRPEIVEAIRTRQEPVFDREDEALVYEVCRSIELTRRIPDPLYERVVQAFGMQGAVELVGIIGYYSYVAMIANAFELEPGTTLPNPLPD